MGSRSCEILHQSLVKFSALRVLSGKTVNHVARMHGSSHLPRQMCDDELCRSRLMSISCLSRR